MGPASQFGRFIRSGFRKSRPVDAHGAGAAVLHPPTLDDPHHHPQAGAAGGAAHRSSIPHLMAPVDSADFSSKRTASRVGAVIAAFAHVLRAVDVHLSLHVGGGLASWFHNFYHDSCYSQASSTSSS